MAPDKRQGFGAATLRNGIRFVALHYSADPDKDFDWAERTKISVDDDEWNREMELRENVWSGERVFKPYQDTFHCPAWAMEKDIQVLSGCHYIGGWDAGDTLAPAFTLNQLRPIKVLAAIEWRLYTVLEVTLEGAWSMEDFAPQVKQILNAWSPEFASKVLHFGDQTLTTRTGPRGETAHKVALENGFSIQPVTNDWETRRSAVVWHLKRKLSDGRAAYILSGRNCPVLKAAFEGAYHYPKSTTHDQSGPGMVVKMPVKNQYSHVSDSLQYAAIIAKQIIEDSVTVKQGTRLGKQSNYKNSQ